MKEMSQHQKRILGLIESAEKQSQMGKVLQAEGIKKLKEIQVNDGEPEAIAKLLDIAQKTIVTGCKIEMDAQKNIVTYSKQL